MLQYMARNMWMRSTDFLTAWCSSESEEHIEDPENILFRFVTPT